jgi:hypothetical protein
MVKTRRRPSPKHSGEAVDRNSGRGRQDDRWGGWDPEDDPLRDLRPDEDDSRNPSNDEYIWPDLNNEYDEDD